MHATNRRTKSNTESNHIATKSNKNQTSKQEDLVILVWDLDLAVKNWAATMALCAGPAAGQGLVFDRQLLGQGKYNTTLRLVGPSRSAAGFLELSSEPDNIEQCGMHCVLMATPPPMDAADTHLMQRRHGTEGKEVDDEPTCRSPWTLLSPPRYGYSSTMTWRRKSMKSPLSRATRRPCPWSHPRTPWTPGSVKTRPPWWQSGEVAGMTTPSAKQGGRQLDRRREEWRSKEEE
jgi:hypothetical protein